MRDVWTVELARCGKIRSRDWNPDIPDDAQHAPACFFVCIPAHAKFMAAQAGQLNSWPVSFGTGSSNPVWAATP
ncbi:ash family protein [Salmonella enterica subsp. enterica]